MPRLNAQYVILSMTTSITSKSCTHTSKLIARACYAREDQTDRKTNDNEHNSFRSLLVRSSFTKRREISLLAVTNYVRRVVSCTKRKCKSLINLSASGGRGHSRARAAHFVMQSAQLLIHLNEQTSSERASEQTNERKARRRQPISAKLVIYGRVSCERAR